MRAKWVSKSEKHVFPFWFTVGQSGRVNVNTRKITKKIEKCNFSDFTGDILIIFLQNRFYPDVEFYGWKDPEFRNLKTIKLSLLVVPIKQLTFLNNINKKPNFRQFLNSYALKLYAVRHLKKSGATFLIALIGYYKNTIPYSLFVRTYLKFF